MRIWSLHPKYLDRMGLLAVWREALLAQKVLKNKTKRYKDHPQLNRFKSHSAPLAAIASYLNAIYDEACSRGYSFNKNKIGLLKHIPSIAVTNKQLEYEFLHLLKKLTKRNPQFHKKIIKTEFPIAHPLFKVVDGEIEPWEKIS